MKREAIQQALVILLVVAMASAGVPLAHFVQEWSDGAARGAPGGASARDGTAGGAGSADGATGDPAPGSDPSPGGAATSPYFGPTLAGSSFASLDFPQIVPADALDEVTSLLRDAGVPLTGSKVPLPALVYDLPVLNPLRPALLGWVAATESVVPPDELASALADADALPQDVQKDLAILVLAATQATLLQRSALAGLTSEEIAFLENNPQAAQDLAAGLRTPEALRLVELAGKVDVTKSLQASLLLVSAIERTRGSLSSRADDDLAPQLGALDEAFVGVGENALALLALAEQAESRVGSRESKLRYAGDLLAAGAGIARADDPRPYLPPLSDSDPLGVALAHLLKATAPLETDFSLAFPELAKARALPDELQRALAVVVLARAETLAASRDALALHADDPDAAARELARADAIGALKTLSAMERALPVLEKYNLWWSSAPRWQRAAIAQPEIGVVTALRHAGALTLSSGSLASTLSAAGASAGLDAPAPRLREIDLSSAVREFYAAQGRPFSHDEVQDLDRAVDALPPEVRRAASLLVTAQVDASLARERAFADVSPAELAFLLERADDVRAALDRDRLAAGDLVLLRSYSEIASRVRPAELLAGALVLAKASDVAAELLTEAGWGDESRVTAQAAGARVRETGWRALVAGAFSLLGRASPFGTAAAQAQGEPQECPATPSGFGDCERDIWFNPLGREDIVISGELGRFYSTPSINGRSAVWLDLGGSDIYRLTNGGTGMVISPQSTGAPNAGQAYPASIMLDVGGADVYDTPTTYKVEPLDPESEVVPWYGAQGAGIGGIGFLVDLAGADKYLSYGRSQGFGHFGVGVLADLGDGSGSDTYEANSLAQGATFPGLSFGLGLLVEMAGDDSYNVKGKRGQGYGQGAFFLDLGGERDTYAPSTNVPLGIDTIAYAELGQNPAPLLGKRANHKAWVDGPNVVDQGLGVDTEASAKDSDGDNAPDLVEFLLGTDPTNLASNPETLEDELRADELKDQDQDGFTDVVENALGTDPKDPTDAPFGFPSLPPLRDPTSGGLQFLFELYADTFESDATTDQPGPYESGKLIDLKVPFPGSKFHLDALCDDYFKWQSVAIQTGGGPPNEDSILPPYPTGVNPQATTDGASNAINDIIWAFQHPGEPRPKDSGPVPVSPDPDSDGGSGFFFAQSHCQGTVGQGNTEFPALLRGGGNTTLSEDGEISHSANSPRHRAGASQDVEEYSEEIAVRVPPGVFALGDVVSTRYYTDYLLSIDLGGNDRHEERAGGGSLLRTTVSSTRPASGPLTGGTIMAPMQTLSLAVPVGLVTLDFDPNATLSASAFTKRAGDDVYDATLNRTQGTFKELAHGAGLGILLDTAGNDLYVAGSDAQGAHAGTLLDLEGNDVYRAKDRAQGATLVHAFDATASKLTTGPSSAEAGQANSERVFRSVFSSRPSLLIDYQGSDAYRALNRSQGYARGVVDVSSRSDSTSAATPVGALLDLSGGLPPGAASRLARDVYESFGFYSQGVAKGGGVGLLMDFRGADVYRARGGVSQGAVEPWSFARADDANRLEIPAVGKTDLRDFGGAGVLFDAEAHDRYLVDRETGVLSRTAERANRTTTRFTTGVPLELAGAAATMNARLVSGAGVHADHETTNQSLVDTLAGSADAFASGPGGTALGFLVDLPSAKLAIGANAPTRYEKEYAFVVDFGGRDRFTNNAAGPVVDALADGGFGASRLLLTQYPVTLVYEVSVNATEYVATRPLAQAVGYFTVGMIADAGGADTYRVERPSLPYFPSRWTIAPPALNGEIPLTGSEWAYSANTTMTPFAMVDLNASESLKNVTLFVMNDAENLYVGVRHAIDAAPGAEPEDVLAPWTLDVQFDTDHDHRAWEGAGTEYRDVCGLPTSHRGAPGADGVLVARRGSADVALDRHLNSTEDGFVWSPDCTPRGEDSRNDATGYRSFRNGIATYEIAKPINSGDLQDINVTSDSLGGWTNPVLGFRVVLRNDATNEEFTWPARSAGADGQPGTDTLADGSLAEELATWGTLHFATGADKEDVTHKAPLKGVVGVNATAHGHERAFAQGAGVAGVGALLSFGNARASASFTADSFVQGAGALFGVGLLYDGGGSDRYAGSTFAQGASALSGVGLLHEADGNDQYVATAFSQGFAYGIKDDLVTEASKGGARATGLAFFADAGGDDRYVYGQVAEQIAFGANASDSVPDAADPVRPFVETSAQVAAPTSKTAPLNDRVWSQPPPEEIDPALGAGPVGNGEINGVGVDFRAMDAVFFGDVQDLTSGFTWDPTMAYIVQEDRGEGCKPTRTVGTAGALYRIEGRACLKVFVYFENGGPSQGAGASQQTPLPTPPGMAFDRLDVFVGGRLHKSYLESEVVRASEVGLRVTNTHETRRAPDEVDADYLGHYFEIRDIDTSKIDDGRLDVAVRAFFATSLTPEGQLQTTGENPDDFWWEHPELAPAQPYVAHRTLLGFQDDILLGVDNAPRVAASATPALPVAGPAFSPTAIGRPSSLSLHWAASHDLGEDRTSLDGVYPSLKNEPWSGWGAPRLANVVPYYMIPGSTTLGNTPVSSPDSSPSTFNFAQGGKPEEWDLKPDTDLFLPAGHSVALRLFRTAVFSDDYVTNVTIVDKDTGALVAWGNFTAKDLGTAPNPVGGFDPDLDLGDLFEGGDPRCLVYTALDAATQTTCAWPDGLWDPYTDETGVAALDALPILRGDVCVVLSVLKPVCDRIDKQDGDNMHTGSPSQAAYRAPRLRTSMLMDHVVRLTTEGEWGGPVHLGDYQAPATGTTGWTPLHAALPASDAYTIPWRTWLYAGCNLNETFTGEEEGCTTPTGEASPVSAPASPLAGLFAGAGESGAPDSNPPTGASGETSLCTNDPLGSEADCWNRFSLHVAKDVLLKKGGEYRVSVLTTFEASMGVGLSGTSDVCLGANEMARVVPVAPDLTGTCNGLASLSEANQFPEIIMREGALSYPARVELYVPTEPATTVSIRAESPANAEVTHAIRSLDDAPQKVEGEIDACEREGRGACRTTLWPASSATDGTWRIRFSSNETDPRQPTTNPALEVEMPASLLGRVREGTPTTLSVLVDRTAPTTTMLMPQTDDLRASGAQRSVLGRSFLSSGNQFDIVWRTEDPGAAKRPLEGAGVEAIDVFVTEALADGGIPVDATLWTHKGTFVSNRQETKHTVEGGATTFYVAVVARDRVGNVEDLLEEGETFEDPACSVALVPDLFTSKAKQDACFATAARAALAAKIERTLANPLDPNGVYRIDLDLTVPTLSGPSIVGSVEGLVNGVERTLVAGEKSATLRVCAADTGSGLERVNAFFVYLPTEANSEIKSVSRRMGATANGCFETQWGREKLNKSVWPDGLYTVGFEAFDRGSNRAEIVLDDVMLDSAKPVVSAAKLLLPEGQVAVKPGDRVDFLLNATDGIALDEVTPGAISIRVSDVSRALTKNVSRSPLPGFTHRAAFTVDKAGLENGLYTIAWTVTDVAGNVANGTLPIAVNMRDYSIDLASVRVVNVTYDSATVEWTTSENALAKVLYGFKEFDLSKTSATTTSFGTTHRVTLKGLLPSTTYFFKPVALSEGGLVREGASDFFRTETALYLDPVAPLPDGAISGLAEIRWKGGLRTGSQVPAFRVELAEAASAPWQIVATTAERGEDHAVRVNTSRFPDAEGYLLRITAEAGGKSVERIVTPVTIDNAAPEVTILSSRKATREFAPVVNGTARDLLSGLDAAGFAASVDGKPFGAGSFTIGAPSADGTVSWSLPLGSLTAGRHAIRIAIADRAGATHVEEFTLALDQAAPALKAAPVAYAPGPLAAKDGARVTLNVTATDASGVDDVTAALPEGLTRAATGLALSRVPGTDHWTASFQVDAPARQGEFRIPVRAVDPAGNVGELFVAVLVDSVPPTLGAPAAQDIGHTSARVVVAADEPVSATVVYTAPSSRGETAPTPRASATVVEITGLLPSRTYAFELRAVDRAGNFASKAGSFATAKDIVAPARVPSLKLVDLHDGKLRLEWGAATDDVGVAAYRVFRAEGAPGEAAPRLLTETRSLFLEESGLPLETLYTYTVVAVDWGENVGPESPAATGASTSPPILLDGRVSENAGTASATTFKFAVRYVSPGGVAPAYVRVLLDGAPRDMVQVGGSSASEGLDFELVTKLSPTRLESPHTYQFEASDGRYIVKFPKDAPIDGPLVSGDLLAEKASGLVAFAKRVPVVGAVGFLGAFAVAAVAVVLLRRRSL